MLPPIRSELGAFPAASSRIEEEFDALDDLTELLTDAICDDPPLAMKEGGIIRDGYSRRWTSSGAKRRDGRWLAELEQGEGERPASIR